MVRSTRPLFILSCIANCCCMILRKGATSPAPGAARRRKEDRHGQDGVTNVSMNTFILDVRMFGLGNLTWWQR
uniref:Putative secreted protein n=1 Tax=Ixodes ricinus TaxID=34613 RepID=A0A6B0UAC7_IXORI